ncbi:hypothetical protein DINM_006573 [Dirofilaria immitis]|nr:hypothetical protein [Dirofilaria immitis]
MQIYGDLFLTTPSIRNPRSLWNISEFSSDKIDKYCKSQFMDFVTLDGLANWRQVFGIFAASVGTSSRVRNSSRVFVSICGQLRIKWIFRGIPYFLRAHSQDDGCKSDTATVPNIL